jgi:hypothetical protein
MKTGDTVYLVYVEKSDQYGTSEVAGVYSSRERAEAAETIIRRRRTFVKEFNVDAAPIRPRGMDSW